MVMVMARVMVMVRVMNWCDIGIQGSLSWFKSNTWTNLIWNFPPVAPGKWAGLAGQVEGIRQSTDQLLAAQLATAGSVIKFELDNQQWGESGVQLNHDINTEKSF